ncbi:MAG: cytochrome c maturation protein CcmE [Candidatus Binatia bacterium]|nr:cytochrome c maturation protein CcmE [Candidatus Binatia bacterium]
MNRKQKFALGSFVIVAAVATLIYTAARETSAYFLTMDEYAAQSRDHEGHQLRLAGRVTDGSVEWNPRTLDLAFEIQSIPPRADAEEATPVAVVEPVEIPPTLVVKYNGILPDMFAEGRDVIVEGQVTNEVFVAETLLTTCPSKYEAEVTPDGYGDEADASGQLRSG